MATAASQLNGLNHDHLMQRLDSLDREDNMSLPPRGPTQLPLDSPFYEAPSDVETPSHTQQSNTGPLLEGGARPNGSNFQKRPSRADTAHERPPAGPKSAHVDSTGRAEASPQKGVLKHQQSNPALHLDLKKINTTSKSNDLPARAEPSLPQRHTATQSSNASGANASSLRSGSMPQRGESFWGKLGLSVARRQSCPSPHLMDADSISMAQTHGSTKSVTFQADFIADSMKSVQGDRLAPGRAIRVLNSLQKTVARPTLQTQELQTVRRAATESAASLAALSCAATAALYCPDLDAREQRSEERQFARQLAACSTAATGTAHGHVGEGRRANKLLSPFFKKPFRGQPSPKPTPGPSGRGTPQILDSRHVTPYTSAHGTPRTPGGRESPAEAPVATSPRGLQLTRFVKGLIPSRLSPGPSPSVRSAASAAPSEAEEGQQEASAALPQPQQCPRPWPQPQQQLETSEAMEGPASPRSLDPILLKCWEEHPEAPALRAMVSSLEEGEDAASEAVTGLCEDLSEEMVKLQELEAQCRRRMHLLMKDMKNLDGMTDEAFNKMASLAESGSHKLYQIASVSVNLVLTGDKGRGKLVADLHEETRDAGPAREADAMATHAANTTRSGEHFQRVLRQLATAGQRATIGGDDEDDDRRLEPSSTLSGTSTEVSATSDPADVYCEIESYTPEGEDLYPDDNASSIASYRRSIESSLSRIWGDSDRVPAPSTTAMSPRMNRLNSRGSGSMGPWDPDFEMFESQGATVMKVSSVSKGGAMPFMWA